MNHPIENIKWVKAEDLNPNDYNPNVVLNEEMKLLAHSLLLNGWIQPILISQDNVVIDGYHRYWLTLNDKNVNEMSDGKVPCAVLELTEAERKMLTIRINRAKGSHVAIKMHEIVVSLVKDCGLSIKEIQKGIGATKDEVELLLMDNVFKKLDTASHKYSKAWVPK